jgi:hypothetical protein
MAGNVSGNLPGSTHGLKTHSNIAVVIIIIITFPHYLIEV